MNIVDARDWAYFFIPTEPMRERMLQKMGLFPHLSHHHDRVQKGGQPFGSTPTNRHHINMSEIVVKNEIALIFDAKRKEAGKKRLKCGCFDEIIQTVKQK